MTHDHSTTIGVAVSCGPLRSMPLAATPGNACKTPVLRSLRPVADRWDGWFDPSRAHSLNPSSHAGSRCDRVGRDHPRTIRGSRCGWLSTTITSGRDPASRAETRDGRDADGHRTAIAEAAVGA